ncbi:MAG: glycosyltransferase family 4 protein [Casimicrobiaceae bacterium]
MKVAIATVQVPFLRGGAEGLAASLRDELCHRGIDADIVSVPFKWYPPSVVIDHMLAVRMLDLTEVNGEGIDRVITLKFPAFYIEHPLKVAWILHQHRQAYDLFGTEFGDLHQTEQGRAVAEEIARWDTAHLSAHRNLFTISALVSRRLREHNALESKPLYHPPPLADRFSCNGFSPFILVPGRLDPIKRQHLAIEALGRCPGTLRLIIIGPRSGPYRERLERLIGSLGLSARVEIKGEVGTEEKLRLYAECLAVYNGAYDEDYGYVTLEAFLAGKPVITHTDSGGALEFVTEGANGRIVPPDADSLASAMSALVGDMAQARAWGGAGRASLAEKGVDWDHVIEALLR